MTRRGAFVGTYMLAPRALSPRDTLEAAQKMMSDSEVSHIPVVAQGRLLGMLSLHDVLDGISEDKTRPIGVEFPLAPLMVAPVDEVLVAAQLMRRHHVSSVAVVAHDQLVGLLLAATVVRLATRRACIAIRVDELMTRAPLVTVPVHSRLLQAKAMMRRGQIRHVPVMEGHRVVGILSDRDVLAVCRASLESPDKILAGEVMNPWPQVVAPDRSASEVGEALLRNSVGAIPVESGGRLAGIVTKSDFVAQYIAFEGARTTLDFDDDAIHLPASR